ncbi:MAG: hypothetical protein JXA66_02110 [Oligoflexia bacterium]|nr:hypothetical protein [Oligoflexia bacterium]
MMSVGKAGTFSKSEDLVTRMSDPTAAKNDKNESVGSALNKLATGTATGEPTSTKVKNNDELNKEDFMTLLVAELQNQDPLEPKSNQEFGAQLAQFSQLEQLETMNKNLTKVTSSNEPVMKMYSASLIGKSVVAESKDLDHEKGKTHDISFNLPESAGSVEVKVLDSTDNVVRTIKMNDVDAGLNSAKWDGRGSDGRLLDDGKYRFEVAATDVHGADVKVERGVNGKVVSVDYSNNDVSLVLENGNKIKLNDIKNISDAVKAYKDTEQKSSVNVEGVSNDIGNENKNTGVM